MANLPVASSLLSAAVSYAAYLINPRNWVPEVAVGPRFAAAVAETEVVAAVWLARKAEWAEVVAVAAEDRGALKNRWRTKKTKLA